MKLRTFCAHATRAKSRVESYPNVRGLAWGVKISGKRVTRRRCITVFVAKKPLESQLDRSKIISKSLLVSGKRIPTDVVKLGKMRLESYFLQNGNKRGATSIHAWRNPDLLAVSCAHVMAGNDGVFTKDDAVEYFDNSWKELGPVVAVQKDKGFGTAEEWGWFDGAIARIDDPALVLGLGPLVAAQPFDHVANADQIPNLVGQEVIADRANGNRLQAVITNVMTDAVSGGFARHDLLIQHREGIGLTRSGDSGLVWRLTDGTPCGVHLGGYNQVGGLSTVSAAFFVQRIANRFAVQLVE